MAKNANNQPDRPKTREHLLGLSAEELGSVAAEVGLSPDKAPSETALVDVILTRQSLIQALDRSVLVELAKWGHLWVRSSADKAELVARICKLRKMRFDGLSRGALVGLARLRGMDIAPDAEAESTIGQLKDQEGIRSRFGRKRRRFVAKMVAKLVGEAEESDQADQGSPSLTQHIEDRGLVGGLADKLRGAADDYVAVKLDEIERWIDHKLDDIDRRLAQWRDREIANRLRIIKMTLVASVIITLISVVMAWLEKTYGG